MFMQVERRMSKQSLDFGATPVLFPAAGFDLDRLTTDTFHRCARQADAGAVSEREL
jgi:hypothetical protein